VILNGDANDTFQGSTLTYLSDRYVYPAAQILLGAVVIFRVLQAWSTPPGGPIVDRGEKSMGMLAAGFAATFGLFVVLAEVSSALDGYKVVFVIADFLILLYLFFFNTRFRNWIIGHFLGRTKER
jgi:hypothetical protein